MERRDGDLRVSPAPARWSCCRLPRRPVPRHLATKRLGGCCDWNGRTEKRKAHRIFVCHLAISTSLAIWRLLAHRRVRRFNWRDTSWKGCGDGPPPDAAMASAGSSRGLGGRRARDGGPMYDAVFELATAHLL